MTCQHLVALDGGFPMLLAITCIQTHYKVILTVGTSYYIFHNCSILDYEVIILYPYLESMVKEKNFFYKKLAPFLYNVLFIFAMAIDVGMRSLHYILMIDVPHIEEFIPVLYMVLMGIYSSTFLDGFILFTLVQVIVPGCKFFP